MFVYDPSHAPIWYGGTLYPTGASFTWSGANYVTSGPWFGNVPFDPAQVSNRIVGTMTWAATSTTTGTLTYTVDGVSVTKLLTRQTLVFDDFSGNFQGAIHRAANSCSNPGTTRPTELSRRPVHRSRSDTAMSITTSDALGDDVHLLGHALAGGPDGLDRRVPTAAIPATAATSTSSSCRSISRDHRPLCAKQQPDRLRQQRMVRRDAKLALRRCAARDRAGSVRSWPRSSR